MLGGNIALCPAPTMSASFDVPPWFYTDFAAEVRHPALKDLQRRLDGLRAGADLPTVTAADPLDLRDFLGNLFIIAIGPDERDFTYTLIGTKIVDVLDRDSTGRTVAETFPPDHPITDVYVRACRERCPVRTYGQLDWVKKEHRQFESLMTPLIDGSGAVVKILGAAYYTSGPSENTPIVPPSS